MAGELRGLISVEQLRRLVASGRVTTVVNAICDMQGRLMGKRVTGEHFVEHCLEDGTHFCVYLLGTDMEMTTPAGTAGKHPETSRFFGGRVECLGGCRDDRANPAGSMARPTFK